MSFFLIVYVAFALYTDLTRRKVYNAQIVLGLLCGFFYVFTPNTQFDLIHWFYGVSCAFLCLIPFYLVRGMAAGDVKLLMSIGGLVGYPKIWDVLIHTFIFGGVFGLGWVLYHRKLFTLISNLKLILMSFFIKATAKIDIDVDSIQQQSVGRMPYVTAIAASVFYIVVFK